ncbi:uncharacterized protein LOC134093571 [Sardina pilchardus]|uniref:uncharacterized protein LOC134093571 n=1 Tax=Sardina pilchardus TaxID=27697 RepID=UPI002E1511AE
MDLPLPSSCADTPPVDPSVVVKEEDLSDEEHGYMIPFQDDYCTESNISYSETQQTTAEEHGYMISFQDDDELFAELYCRTETDVTEPNVTYSETRQTTAENDVEKEEFGPCVMVKVEDIKEEEYDHMIPCPDEEEKPFAELHCRTETDVTESNDTCSETQTNLEKNEKKEEDVTYYLLGNPVSLAQMKRVSVVLVDCCRPQGRRVKKEEEMQTQTNGDAEQPETSATRQTAVKRPPASPLQQGTAKRHIKKVAAVSNRLLCDEEDWTPNMESRLAARRADLTAERARVSQLLAENALLKADLSASRAETVNLRQEMQHLSETSLMELLVPEMKAEKPIRGCAVTPAPELDSSALSDCRRSPSALSSFMDSIHVPHQWADVSLRAFGPKDHVRLHQQSFGQVGRYGCLLFRHVISEENYQAWSKTTNWDGSRGKRALPQNVKSFVISTLKKQFPDMDRGKLKESVDKINEFLRTTRKNSQV